MLIKFNKYWEMFSLFNLLTKTVSKFMNEDRIKIFTKPNDKYERNLASLSKLINLVIQSL